MATVVSLAVRFIVVPRRTVLARDIMMMRRSESMIIVTVTEDGKISKWRPEDLLEDFDAAIVAGEITREQAIEKLRFAGFSDDILWDLEGSLWGIPPNNP